MDVLTLQAPAKANLALAVGPRGPDGFHEICSWMVTIDLCDELDVARLEPGRLSRYAILWHDQARRRSEIDWSITDDLAVRAHLALEERAGRGLPVQLRLAKRIPVGGGLGGGSSAAAAMLHAVTRLYALDASVDDLAETGASLGSDVPFLVHGGSAIVEGRGERVTRLPSTTDLHLVLVFPGVRCPTAEVYRRFDDDPSGPLRAGAVRALASAGGGLDPAAPFNDLAAAAVRVAPELGDLIERIATVAERPAHVSGSGSTIFVVCDEPMHAQALAEAIERDTQLPAVSARGVDSMAYDLRTP
ncbi:MAG: 4-(cytidine 5'-diphospho)-2-C-methyl-D-erythritol kinase [Planctomycetes bacterium]|nr:4-(cytidine 5'-diphospho)-2-C-methyl-D-erythritol kinase [Planctomycetota bacterium]